MSLKIRERTDEKIVVELGNGTEHPIYVSYSPPNEGEVTKFLTYSLERRSQDVSDFKPYGQPFHFVPPLSPLAPRSTIVFSLLDVPTEEGEYRVAVRFYDDSSIYKLIDEKTPHLSELEQEHIDRSRKVVRSETFTIQAKPR